MDQTNPREDAVYLQLMVSLLKNERIRPVLRHMDSEVIYGVQDATYVATFPHRAVFHISLIGNGIKLEIKSDTIMRQARDSNNVHVELLFSDPLVDDRLKEQVQECRALVGQKLKLPENYLSLYTRGPNIIEASRYDADVIYHYARNRYGD